MRTTCYLNISAVSLLLFPLCLVACGDDSECPRCPTTSTTDAGDAAIVDGVSGDVKTDASEATVSEAAVEDGTASEAEASTPTKQYNMYVLTGQSNALGATSTAPAPTPDPADEATHFFWSNVPSSNEAYPPELIGDSAAAITKLQVQQTFWGSEFGFARTLHAVGVRDVLVVKVTRSGGGSHYWSKDLFDSTPGQGHMWGHLRDNLDKVLEIAEQTGYEVNFRGLLYLQGESNTAAEANAAGTDLAKLINNVRNHVAENHPNVNIALATVIGEIGGISLNPTRETTTGYQRDLADSRSDVSFIQTRDLAFQTDNLHFAPASLMTIGQRYADAVLDMQDRSSSVLARFLADFAQPTPIPHPTTQGWTEMGAGTGSAFEATTDGTTRAWRITDQSTTGCPGYFQPLTKKNHERMLAQGWVFRVKVKALPGGEGSGGVAGLALWSVGPTGAPAKWNVEAGLGNMNGFVIERVQSDQFQVRLWETPTVPAVNLGAGSADTFHELELRGAAGTDSFTFSVDGKERGSSKISAGKGVKDWADYATFASGCLANGAENGASAWNEVLLEAESQ